MASVLLCEHEPVASGLLALSLRRAGHSVAEAGSAQEVIDRYRQNPTDVVVLGFAASDDERLRAIRTLTSEFPRLNVVALMGCNCAQELSQAARRMGARRIFSKPIEMHSLLLAIHHEETQPDELPPTE